MCMLSNASPSLPAHTWCGLGASSRRCLRYMKHVRVETVSYYLCPHNASSLRLRGMVSQTSTDIQARSNGSLSA